jgi:hypothetical protein
MTERERAINQDLHVLDEAHRLGRITRAEYRARRRRVLGSLYDSSGVVTARKTLVPGIATTQRTRHAHQGTTDASAAAGRAMTTLLTMRPGVPWKPLLAILAGAILVVFLVYWLLRGA